MYLDEDKLQAAVDAERELVAALGNDLCYTNHSRSVEAALDAAKARAALFSMILLEVQYPEGS